MTKENGDEKKSTNEEFVATEHESDPTSTITTTTTTTIPTATVPAGSSENDKLFIEWKAFLQQKDRIDLLLAATEAVTQLPPRLLPQCVQHDFVPLLVKHVAYTTNDEDDAPINKNTSASSPLEQVSVNALRALVYLSSHGMGSTNQCVYDLITVGKGMNRMMEIVLSNPPSAHNNKKNIRGPHHWSTRVNYAMALIANMTRTELGAVEFIGHTLPEEPIYHHHHHDPPQEPNDSTTPSDRTTTKPLTVKPTLELLLHRYLNPKYVHDEDVNYHALLTRDNEADDDDDDADDDDANDQQITASTAITPYIEKDASASTNPTTDALRNRTKNATLDSLDHDPYQHLAAILLNITAQSALGRQFVLQMHRTTSTTSTTNGCNNSVTPDNGHGNPKDDESCTVLQLLLGQLKSRNPLRRRGIAGMVRNICQQERDAAWWLLNVVQLNRHLLYPLAGPEELDYDDKQGLHVDLWMEGPDKVREPDHITRLFLIEAILFLLSTGRASRNTMRLQRTYVILKMADLVEEMEDVSAVICDCVNYLRRDEHDTAEGSSDALIEETYQLKSKLSSADTSGHATAATPLPNDDDEDDFDNVD